MVKAPSISGRNSCFCQLQALIFDGCHHFSGFSYYSNSEFPMEGIKTNKSISRIRGTFIKNLVILGNMTMDLEIKRLPEINFNI